MDTPNSTYIQHLQITVTQSMTTPSKPGKKPRPVWEVTGNIDGLEDELYAIGGKKWRGKFSFWSDPTEQLQKLDNDDRLTFAAQEERKRERASDRVDRLEARADKHQAVSTTALNTAHQIGSMIPMGQPILVGHHSEKRHRRDIARIDSNMRKGIDAGNYAQHLSDRAETNRQKAEGGYTKSYLGNRIAEVEAEIRDIQRKLNGQSSASGYQPATGEWKAKLEARLGQAQEKLDYWQQELEKLGGVGYSKETVKPGDYVLRGHGIWYKVFRSNAKSCSMKWFNDDQSWNNTSPWTEIQGHMTIEEWENYDGQKVKNGGVNGWHLIPNKPVEGEV